MNRVSFPSLGQRFPFHTVRVNFRAVEEMMDRVVIQFHRFPGTDSIVAHASLDGKELAVATGPCIDTRNFSDALGQHNSERRVRELAKDKLFEILGIALIYRAKDWQGTTEEFMERYKDEYIFDVIPLPATPPQYPPLKRFVDSGADVIDLKVDVPTASPETGAATPIDLGMWKRFASTAVDPQDGWKPTTICSTTPELEKAQPLSSPNGVPVIVPGPGDRFTGKIIQTLDESGVLDQTDKIQTGRPQ